MIVTLMRVKQYDYTEKAIKVGDYDTEDIDDLQEIVERTEHWSALGYFLEVERKDD